MWRKDVQEYMGQERSHEGEREGIQMRTYTRLGELHSGALVCKHRLANFLGEDHPCFCFFLSTCVKYLFINSHVYLCILILAHKSRGTVIG